MTAGSLTRQIARTPAVKWRAAVLALALLAVAGAVLVVSLAIAPDERFADGVDEAGVTAPKLAAHLEKHSQDARAWAIYARLQFARGDYAQSAAAYEKAVAIHGKVARDPLVWCEYADAVALASGGKLAGKPRELIGYALMLDRKNPRALEMAGSAEIEARNFSAALDYWERLLAVLPAEAPERAELVKAVERTRMRAGR